MKKLFISLVISTSLGISMVAQADKVAVIVNKSNGVQAISDADLKGIFLGKKTSSEGTRYEVVEMSQDSESKVKFHETITKKSLQQLNAYWSRRVFTGKGEAPYALDDQKRIVEYVGLTPNAIGYVPESAIDDSVKVIKVLE